MIAILLATYNSERYLSEQIDSILNQTYNNWKLYIRDDGSQDSTLSIIRDYQLKWEGKIIVLFDEKGPLKSYKNFIELLNYANADYYMFCDHDDVWLPNKIEISMYHMLELEQVHGTKPIVVHTDMKVVDQNLNVISPSFWNYSKLLQNHCSFWELVCCNSVNGCTMLFNHQAKLSIKGNEPYCMMHDTLVSQSTAAHGGVLFAIKMPTVLYRQHFDNVIGAANAKSGYFMRQLMTIKKTLKRNYEVWERACHIKKISFILFMLIKMKITTLRVFR